MVDNFMVDNFMVAKIWGFFRKNFSHQINSSILTPPPPPPPPFLLKILFF